MVFSEVTRKQAFVTHLMISAFFFALLSYLIVFHWFPEFYFYLDGGDRAIAILFLVVVILGPSLTLLVFRPGKKSLKFDMAVILLLQSLALVWGVNAIYTQRSGTAVFYWGKFSCLTHKDTRDMNMTAIADGASGRQRLSFLQRPDTFEEFHNLVEEAYQHASSEIYYHSEKIVPLDERVVMRLKNYRLNLSALAAENDSSAKAVQAYLDNHVEAVEYINLVPLSCRFGSVIAVYDVRELKITDWIEVKTALRAEAQDEPLPVNPPRNDNKSKFFNWITRGQAFPAGSVTASG